MELGWIVASPAHRVLPKTCGAEEVEASISCRAVKACRGSFQLPQVEVFASVCPVFASLEHGHHRTLEGFRHSELGQLTLITSPSGSFLALGPLPANKVPAENSWTCFSPWEKTR